MPHATVEAVRGCRRLVTLPLPRVFEISQGIFGSRGFVVSAAFFFDRCSRGIAIPTLLHPPVVLGRVPCGSLAHRRDPRVCMCAGRFDETQSILDRLHVY